MAKAVKGKSVNKVVDYEVVKAKLHSEAMKIELDMLTVIGFDFECHFPFNYIRHYLTTQQNHTQVDTALKHCLDTVYL